MSVADRATMNVTLPFREWTSFHVDKRLLLIAAMLLGIGLVMLTSASVGVGEKLHGDAFYFLKRQLQAIALGLAAGAVLLAIPLSAWERLSFLVLLFGLILLAIVVVPGVGNTVNGATRWLSVGGLTLQASEPARIALLLYIAGYAVRQQQSLRHEFVGLLRPMLVLALAAFLLLLEPDFGAAVVLLATALGLLFLAGARVRDFLIFVLIGLAVFIPLALIYKYRLRRVLAFLNPWAYENDEGFQLIQSQMAIAGGEWFGAGLGNSVQKLFYLPEAHTDFVFAVFAEEFGFVGTAILVGLFMALIVRIIRIAREAAALSLWFEAYVATGIGIWLGLQSFINIGVNLGLLPTKGLTLPLISYGRSSIIVVIAALCLVLRVAHEVRRAELGVTASGRRNR